MERRRLNDEVNLAVLGQQLAAVIEKDFAEELEESRPLTLAMLRQRSWFGVCEEILNRPRKVES